MYLQRKQRGGSPIGLIITLVIIGYAAFVGIQYVPQKIEFSTVEGMLDNIEQFHKSSRYDSQQAVANAINKQLGVNVMDDLRDSFKVTRSGSHLVIKVSYERDLNLLYEKKLMKYEETLTLK